MPESDRHGVHRESAREVHCAVEWIHKPCRFAVFRRLIWGFFGDYRQAARLEVSQDASLGLEVGASLYILAMMAANIRICVERCQKQGRCGARSFDRQVQLSLPLHVPGRPHEHLGTANSLTL